MLVSRSERQLVFSQANSNSKLEFDIDAESYPEDGLRPIIVVVEASYLLFRYRVLMPNDTGHQEMVSLLAAGPSVGRGVAGRLVTLDDVESYWPNVNLR